MDLKKLGVELAKLGTPTMKLLPEYFILFSINEFAINITTEITKTINKQCTVNNDSHTHKCSCLYKRTI